MTYFGYGCQRTTLELYHIIHLRAPPPPLDGFLTVLPSRLGGWLAVQFQRSAYFCGTEIVDVGHWAGFLFFEFLGSNLSPHACLQSSFY